MKKKVYLWYSVTEDSLIELGEMATVRMMKLVIQHDFRANLEFMFLGKL